MLLRCSGEIAGVRELPRRFDFNCMCAEWVPAALAMGDMLPDLCLVAEWHKVWCPACTRPGWRVAVCVTKRRNSWACTGNPNPEQETIKGTHTQETPAYQRRPTTQYPAQGSNPPIGTLHMQRAKIPHTHQTTPPATRAASADQHGAHRGRNRYHPSTHTTKDEAPGQLPGAQKHG